MALLGSRVCPLSCLANLAGGFAEKKGWQGGVKRGTALSWL